MEAKKWPEKISVFYCEKCDYKSCKKQNYDKHLLTSKHNGSKNGNKVASQKVAKKYHCAECDYVTCKKTHYDKHLTTPKHFGNINGNKVTQKVTNLYQCIECDYITCKKMHYDEHLLTQKHLSTINESSGQISKCEVCDKTYSTRAGLWKHQQKGCNIKINSEVEEHNLENEIDEKQNLKNLITPELVIMLMQQNKEMQTMMMEQQKFMMEKMIENAGHNVTNTTNIQNNKAFNMNFFLNETCKNAMNMSDFVKNLVVTTDDFEQTGVLGYAEGISRILENGLRKLELHERPIHCSDVKRETIYIKDNDKWEKDDDKKTKLLGYIKQVGHKNINVIPQWQKEHPGWSDSDSKENDRYLKYVFNSMCGGTTQEINSNYGKIMRNVSRITIVDKQEALALINY
jgi:hypothetical protein